MNSLLRQVQRQHVAGYVLDFRFMGAVRDRARGSDRVRPRGNILQT